MNKKIMMLSLAAVSAALMALPAFASAQSLHISSTGVFTVSGGTGELITTSGLRIHCESVTGSGNFTTTTTGTVELLFHKCTDSTFKLHCQTAGQPTGTIKATALEFHLITVDKHGEAKADKEGILITPPSAAAIETSSPTRRLFASFTCFGVTTKVIGTGIIGTITHPGCGVPNSTAGLAFQQASNGHQTHTKYTTTPYDLESSVGGGPHNTSSIVTSATIHFGAAKTLTCT